MTPIDKEQEKQKLMSLLSQRLDALMKKNDINQVELAEKLDVDTSTVGKWLLRKAIPRMGIYQKLSDIFGVPKSFFLEDEDYSNEDLQNEGYYSDPEVAKMANDIHKDPELRILFSASKKLRKEDLQAVINIVKAMKKEDE